MSFLLVTSGSLFYFNARRIWGRILGLFVASSMQLAAVVGSALILFNLEMRITDRLGAALWNYRLVLPNLVVLLVLLPLFFVGFEVLRRRISVGETEIGIG